jgi:hypothetical protein
MNACAHFLKCSFEVNPFFSVITIQMVKSKLEQLKVEGQKPT